MTPAPPALVNGSVDAARAAMLEAARPLGSETVPLGAAHGRVLATAITAQRAHPPFRSAAMDGYAVRRADLERGAQLRVIGESAAGAGFSGGVGPGEAVRIFTGAPVPDGADLVALQEDAERDGEALSLTTAPDAKDNIRPLGVDLVAGVDVLRAGRRLDPAALALAASAGAGAVQTALRPRVAFLPTGAELVEPTDAPGPSQIYESNTPALMALASAWGAMTRRFAPVGDDRQALTEAARAALADADVLVMIGGASVGEHDLAKPALADLGMTPLVDKVKVRPGKPVWFGAVGPALVLGLPGNPASAFVCAHVFLEPLLAALQGAAPGPITPLRARLAAPMRAEGPRETFHRAVLAISAEGTLLAAPSPTQDSSLTSVLARSNGLVRRPAGAPAASVGDRVEALLFEGRALETAR